MKKPWEENTITEHNSSNLYMKKMYYTSNQETCQIHVVDAIHAKDLDLKSFETTFCIRSIFLISENVNDFIILNVIFLYEKDST